MRSMSPVGWYPSTLVRMSARRIIDYGSDSLTHCSGDIHEVPGELVDHAQLLHPEREAARLPLEQVLGVEREVARALEHVDGVEVLALLPAVAAHGLDVASAASERAAQLVVPDPGDEVDVADLLGLRVVHVALVVLEAHAPRRRVGDLLPLVHDGHVKAQPLA